jgi:hypothetical protein
MVLLFDDLDSRVIRAARGPAVYYTLLIILYYCTLLSMSRVIYTTIPNVVCIPRAVQIYGILVTCFDPNKSSAGLNTCTWPYTRKSTMYLQCSAVQFKTIL